MCTTWLTLLLWMGVGERNWSMENSEKLIIMPTLLTRDLHKQPDR